MSGRTVALGKGEGRCCSRPGRLAAGPEARRAQRAGGGEDSWELCGLVLASRF